ncbi:MAG: 1-deoxy-D-xylulose-5-phosphate reductoisomerase [Bacteroidetes bacterium]|nr:1-deoxy-D-xylulose-5-phosphate reductoisomerase [Bacteroidota bacterium]
MIPSLRQFDAAQPDRPRRLAVLGSTGSVGTQTLGIVRLFSDRLKIQALAAGSNWELLAEQARAFQPEVVCIADEARYTSLKDALAGTPTRVVSGMEGLCEIASAADVDVVVAAIVGAAGLRSTLAAVEAGKMVALANKETLVLAGALVERFVREHGAMLIPVDSEHSAIFQCLVGEDAEAVESITLTASGGPFRNRPSDTFGAITKAEALNHPNWSMGPKITIDSATLMNKGLEVIEARWLFSLAPDRINVVVHPQSILHSFVTFVDGSVKAQLGVPDMKVPIQYALTFPYRWSAPHERIDWTVLGSLDFEEPDFERFPCLQLAFEALQQGGTAPAVLNAANEAAVELFLAERIRFTDIPRLIERALSQILNEGGDDLESLLAADQAARNTVREHANVLVS